MLQRGYIILIIGAALLISGVVVSVFWAGSFASSFLSQGVILNDLAIPPSGSANNTIQVTDISHPIALQIHFESHSGNGISVNSQNGQANTTTSNNNNSLREVVRDSNGRILSQNDLSKQFFTTFKPTIPGTYTLVISNLGSNPVRVAALFGSATFVNENNQININLFTGVIAGLVLIGIGIITLIAGIIIVILDRRKGKEVRSLLQLDN
jgi:hypothetical protein